MPYVLTAADAKSISEPEVAFGTTRLLPPWNEIPDAFRCAPGNIYTRIASAIFYASPLPEGGVDLVEELSPIELMRCISAHLRSFQPKHEHKIAGVGYMISLLAKVVPQTEEESAT